MKTSNLSGFYKLSIDERLKLLKDFANLTDDEVSSLKKESSLSLETADRMIENVVGTFSFPLGIATNFLINNKDYLIPMVIEEPSVVAAASNVAKMCRDPGGFKAETTDPIMIGQIHLMDVKNSEEAKKKILAKKKEFTELANSKDSILINFGGGMKDMDVSILDSKQGKIVRTHIFVDCRDAMGANTVNTMVELLTPEIEKLTGGRVYLKIISNFADRRIAKATAVFPKEAIGGEKAVDAILKTYAIADADPYRAATHNKGIMNGISSIVIATGNDFRAMEAGAHAYASRSGEYKPLTSYEKNKKGDLVGKIEIPMQVGTVGGATKVHPTAKICVKILNVKSAQELGGVMAAVGLAQNFAALRAISQEGIQKGHMKLHARNLAASVGSEGAVIDEIAEKMIEEKSVTMTRAKELFDKSKA